MKIKNRMLIHKLLVSTVLTLVEEKPSSYHSYTKTKNAIVSDILSDG